MPSRCAVAGSHTCVNSGDPPENASNPGQSFRNFRPPGPFCVRFALYSSGRGGVRMAKRGPILNRLVVISSILLTAMPVLGEMFKTEDGVWAYRDSTGHVIRTDHPLLRDRNDFSQIQDAAT